MNWHPRTLGECAKLLSGGTPSKANAAYWSGDIPWVSSGEMTQSFIEDTELHVSEDGAENGSRLVPEDTVLLVVRGMSLAKDFRISITRRPMTFNQDLKALKCAADIDPHFIFYALKARKDFIRDLSTEASHGTKKLESSTLEGVEILLPDTIEEQRAAAAVALSYDDLIENNRRRMALLEEAAGQLYKEWFVRFLFPGHEHTEIIDGVPEGWEPLDVGRVASNFDRRRVPLSVMERELRQGEYPYHGAAGILDYIDDFIFDGRFLLLGEDGTVQTSSGAPMLQLVEGKFWVSNHAHVLQGDRVTTEFLYCALSIYPVVGHVTGVAQPKITQANMNRIPILVPTQNLCELFQDAVAPIFDLKFRLTAQSRLLARARDLLLPKLMNGGLAA